MAIPIPVPASGQAGRILSESFVNLEATVPDPTGAPPGLIVAMPTTWANKYQLLLYRAAAGRRYAVVGARTPGDLENIAWPGPVLLHAHWFASIFQGARSRVEAEQRLATAQEQILRFRDRTGAKLLWTAHNVFPHGNVYPDLFMELRRWVFEEFDAIHVMEDSHVPLLEKAFSRPAPKSFVVPHMTYCGTILDSVTPVAARARFGLPEDAFVFGFFGSIQEYKNIGYFLEQFDRLRQSTSRPVAALVGGIPTDTAVARQLDMRWSTDPDVRLLLRKVHDHEIQYLHRGADVIVLPYQETLNSGAAFMAATFRKPYLMPEGRVSDQLKNAGAMCFDADDPDGLLNAMTGCLDGTSSRFDADVLGKFQPDVISEAFFDAVDTLFE